MTRPPTTIPSTAPMPLRRFTELAEAFGADPHCWPEMDRTAAMAFLHAEPETADAVLARERRLDASLKALTVPPPAPFLDQAVAARILSRAGLFDRVRRWFAGAAAATALAGGLAAGIALAPMLGAPAESPSVYAVSVLGTPFDPDETEPDAPAPMRQER